VKTSGEAGPPADGRQADRPDQLRGKSAGWHRKLSCPFAGMTRIRFKGFPRYDVAGVSARLTGAPLGTEANVGPPGPLSTHVERILALRSTIRAFTRVFDALWRPHEIVRCRPLSKEAARN
jgi:hypothetical protein